MNREQRLLELKEWIAEGRKKGFCSAPLCEMHDAMPLTALEEQQVERDEDPCLPIVRINTEMIDEPPFAPDPQEGL